MNQNTYHSLKCQNNNHLGQNNHSIYRVLIFHKYLKLNKNLLNCLHLVPSIRATQELINCRILSSQKALTILQKELKVILQFKILRSHLLVLWILVKAQQIQIWIFLNGVLNFSNLSSNTNSQINAVQKLL